MLKTVKVKKNLRLDELIKYVWDNQLYPETFKSNFNDFAHFDKTGKYKLIDQRGINQATKFAVEVEEEIDYGTVFEEVYRVTKEGYVTSDKNKSIDSCLDWKDYQVQIFAMLDGKLQLIWEEDEDVN